MRAGVGKRIFRKIFGCLETAITSLSSERNGTSIAIYRAHCQPRESCVRCSTISCAGRPAIRQDFTGRNRTILSLVGCVSPLDARNASPFARKSAETGLIS